MNTQHTPRLLLISLALASACASPFALADGKKQSQQLRHSEARRPSVMQTIANDAQTGQRGHGWQYFSDHKAQRAVVISPQGDYYFSQGKGLRWVAADLTVI